MTYRYAALRRFLLYVKTILLARFDAKYKTRNAARVIDRYLGPRPTFDPITNHEHAQIAKKLLTTEADKRKKDLHTIEDQLTHFTPSRYFTIGLVILFLGEYFGASLIFKDLGYAARERAILGLMLTCILFFLTWFAAHMATKSDEQGRPGRSRWLIAVLVAYTLLVLAVAVYRHSTIAAGEETNPAGEIATTLLMLFTSVGPAWLFETLARKREPVAKLTRMRRQIKRRLRKATVEHNAALAFTRQLSRMGQAWDYESKRLRAVYEHTYERCYTKAHGTPPPEEERGAPHRELRVIGRGEP